MKNKFDLKFLGCTIKLRETTDTPQPSIYKVGDIVLFTCNTNKPYLGKITGLEFYTKYPNIIPHNLKEYIHIVRLTKKLKEWKLGDPYYHVTNLDIIENFGQ